MDILVIGRFQPFHNGHLMLIKDALKEATKFEDNKIRIVIGSKQYSFTEDNPFTFDERKEMIEKTLLKERINSFLLYGLEDINSNEDWSKKLLGLVGKVGISYTNNKKVFSILSKKGVKVKFKGYYNRKELSGTAIRSALIEGKNINKFVPNKTLNVIKKTDGEKRIISIHKNKDKRVFTIGHSSRSINELVDLLDEYSIKNLVDIRSIPKFIHNPQFNMYSISRKLNNSGIKYSWEENLGGLRKPDKNSKNNFWKNKSFMGFADYMQTYTFKEAIGRLEKESKTDRTAVMCAEVLPWRCHRFLVSDYLCLDKFSVTHIISHNQTKEHEINQSIQIVDKSIMYSK